jgi:hypothetical protein
VVLANCQRRLCETLGLRRVAREVEITPMDRLRAYQDAKKARLDADAENAALNSAIRMLQRIRTKTKVVIATFV